MAYLGQIPLWRENSVHGCDTVFGGCSLCRGLGIGSVSRSQVILRSAEDAVVGWEAQKWPPTGKVSAAMVTQVCGLV